MINGIFFLASGVDLPECGWPWDEEGVGKLKRPAQGAQHR